MRFDLAHIVVFGAGWNEHRSKQGPAWLGWFALFKAVFLLLTVGAISWEAVQRFSQPVPRCWQKCINRGGKVYHRTGLALRCESGVKVYRSCLAVPMSLVGMEVLERCSHWRLSSTGGATTLSSGDLGRWRPREIAHHRLRHRNEENGTRKQDAGVLREDKARRGFGTQPSRLSRGVVWSPAGKRHLFS